MIEERIIEWLDLGDSILKTDIYERPKLLCFFRFHYCLLKYGITSNENIEKIYLYIKITYNDETSSAGYLSKNEFDRNFDSIKQIKIAIYFTKGLKDIPFSLAIERRLSYF